MAAIARGSGANVVPRTREECAEPRRAGRGWGGGVGTGPGSAGGGGGRLSGQGDEVPRIKLRKQGVSEELGRPYGFSLWIVMFWPL